MISTLIALSVEWFLFIGLNWRLHERHVTFIMLWFEFVQIFQVKGNRLFFTSLWIELDALESLKKEIYITISTSVQHAHIFRCVLHFCVLIDPLWMERTKKTWRMPHESMEVKPKCVSEPRKPTCCADFFAYCIA